MTPTGAWVGWGSRRFRRAQEPKIKNPVRKSLIILGSHFCVANLMFSQRFRAAEDSVEDPATCNVDNSEKSSWQADEPP